ncbi:hypothetical protein ACFXDJ_18125 [Streptomyces sp. NPDC059443]|uniref:hypothetical protein n=1 Tax=unclassified Streptomyces TaxID=2593676 RepID=UPI0036B40E62
MPRTLGRAATALALALTFTTLMTGCSNTVDKANAGLAYTPTVLSVQDAKTKTKAVSSQIFDLIGIKNAKTTPGGASISLNEKDPSHLFMVRHPWSVYGTSDEELTQGFLRLKEALPQHGWKIKEYGRNSTPAKDLELTADSQDGPFSVNVVLATAVDPAKNAPSANNESGIMVHVVSAYFRAPEGTDLNGVY